MLEATKRRWLAYDHVDVVAGGHPPQLILGGHVSGAAGAGGKITAIYVARGRPDAWKPETKRDHRRCLAPGVWACRRPEDESDEEFWASRREIALVHGLSAHHALAHCFADLQRSGTGARSAAVEEGVDRKATSRLQVLSTHTHNRHGICTSRFL